MNILKISGAALALASLAACADPKPATIDAEDVTIAETEYDRLDALGETALADMPSTGTASYDGKFGGDFSADSDADGSFLGDLALDVNFGTGGITGLADNINIIDEEGTPTQLLGGSLDVVGTQTGTGIYATASGDLTGVENGLEGSSSLVLNFDGSFRDDTATADTIVGSVNGSGDGDFYVRVVDGGFFAQD